MLKGLTMRIFMTGATGFIGALLVPELIEAGHEVLGLTRSETSAAALRAAGGEPLVGDMLDLDRLREGVRRSDGVIHLAFNYNADFQKSSNDDRDAVEALAAMTADGKLKTEDAPLAQWNPRSVTEIAARQLADRGVNVSVMRMGVVHDTHKQAFVSFAAQLAKDKGRAAYIGDGSVRWSAAHVTDVAHLYRLAFEKAELGAIYHGVDEEGVSMRAMAEAIGRGLDVPAVSIAPEEAEAHFGWLAMFMGLDLSASSAVTREKLNWQPSGPGLIADLDGMYATSNQTA
jgi:nucleoside-diphosphate-sugar epimerase